MICFADNGIPLSLKTWYSGTFRLCFRGAELFVSSSLAEGWNKTWKQKIKSWLCECQGYIFTECILSTNWQKAFHHSIGGVLLLCHNTRILCCHNNNKSNSLVKKVQRWCGTFFKCIHVLPLHSWPPHLLNSRETWFRLGAHTTQTCTVQRACVHLFNFPYAVLFTSA